MDSRKLRSFITLAEELHFSRAAVRLGISQSALSMRLRTLEDELGVRLFERTTRSVKLTEAGHRLLAEATSVLRTLAATADAVQGTERSDPRLRVGCSTAARYSFTGPVLDRYDAIEPSPPPIALREEASGGVLRALRSFRLDVGITFCSSAPADLFGERLAATRAVITLPAAELDGHDGHIPLTAVAHLPLVLIADEDSAGFNETALAGCRAAGIDPEIAWISRGEANEAFRRTGGFTFVTRSARGFEPDDVAIAEIDGQAPVLVYDLVWRDERAPGVQEFLLAARQERARRGWLEDA